MVCGPGGLLFNGNQMCAAVHRLVNLVLPNDEHLPLLSVGDTFEFIHHNTSPINLPGANCEFKVVLS